MRARQQETFRKKFGRNVRAARKALGLSQRQLAERANVAEKYLSRVELGAVSPSITIAFRLAQAVGVGLDGLTAGDQSERDARLSALVLQFTTRGGAELERAIRVLQALAAEP
jgi:transcriptional regulator with XRE-family HTH domain